MKPLVSLTFAISLACPALAVDGVVLINQSNALAGNVTPGDAPGFPVTISVSGSYRLSSNLTVPDANTTAIDIAADDVTIDLNGYSILGPTVCSGSPVTCSPTGGGNGVHSVNKHTSVSNGAIQGMGGYGVLLTGQFGPLVDNITTTSNGSTGFYALDAIVTRCNASSNGAGGFLGSGTLSNSAAKTNKGDGIVWFGSVTGSLSESNGGNGFYANGVLTNNIADANSGTGILTDLATVVISNFVSANGSKINAANGSVVLNNAQQ
jgi:hypothetical protein